MLYDNQHCLYRNKQGTQCNKMASQTAESVFGRVFYCNKHMAIKRNSLVIRNVEELER